MSQGHAYCGLVRAWDGSTAEKANRRQRHGRDGANEPEHGRDTGTIPTLLSTKDGRKALGSEGPGSWGLTPGTSQQTASLPAWLAEIQRGGVSAVTQVGPGAGDGDGHGSPPQQPQTGPAAAFPHRGALPAGRAPHDKREHVLPTDTGCRLGNGGGLGGHAQVRRQRGTKPGPAHVPSFWMYITAPRLRGGESGFGTPAGTRPSKSPYRLPDAGGVNGKVAVIMSEQ